jgi:hypothetical protein
MMFTCKKLRSVVDSVIVDLSSPSQSIWKAAVRQTPSQSPGLSQCYLVERVAVVGS